MAYINTHDCLKKRKLISPQFLKKKIYKKGQIVKRFINITFRKISWKRFCKIVQGMRG